MKQETLLQEEVKSLHSKGQSILTEFKDIDFPDEKKEEANKLFDKANELNVEIKGIEERENLEKKGFALEEHINKPQYNGIPIADTVEATVEHKEQNREEIEYKSVFENFLRWGENNLSQIQKKSISSRIDPDGGYLVSTEFRSEFIKKLRDIVKIRKYARVIQTKSGELEFPTSNITGSMPHVIEGGTTTKENLTNWLGKKKFTAWERGRIIKIPRSYLEDASSDVIEFIIDDFLEIFYGIEENDFLNGSGVNQPFGLLHANTKLESTAAAGSAPTPEEMIKLEMKLKEGYRSKAVYIMGRATVEALKLLRADAVSADDSKGKFLWENNNLVTGTPNRFNGYPIIESEYFPTVESGAPLVLFGNLKKYWIVDRKAITVKRLNELYAETREIGLDFNVRYDAAPVIREAFWILKAA